MNPDVPCRLSSDELAHDRAQEKLPHWRCKGDQCPRVSFTEDSGTLSDQGWLVCKGPCGEVLCPDCLGDLTDPCKALSWEPLINLGFCSTACLAAAYEAARRQIRAWIVESSKDGLAQLMSRVRAVCNLERK